MRRTDLAAGDRVFVRRPYSGGSYRGSIVGFSGSGDVLVDVDSGYPVNRGCLSGMFPDERVERCPARWIVRKLTEEER